MKRVVGKWVVAGFAAIVGLSALALIPQSSQAENDSRTTPESAPKRCVNGPGIDTHILDQNTILARTGYRAGVLIRVSGCKLDPDDILVFEYFGMQQICSPVDVQLSVRDRSVDIRTACFIQSVTPVATDEVKTLSKQSYQRAGERS